MNLREQLIKKWSNPGYVTPKEQKTILGLIEELKTPYPIVEIGVWEGRTIALMAEFCQMKGLANKIIGIDPFKGYFYDGLFESSADKEIADKNISPYPNASLIKGFSYWPSVIRQIDKISLLFIDGNHDYQAVELDIKNWFPKVQEYCLFHDFDIPEVATAVSEQGFRASEIVDTIGVIKI